MAIAIRSNGQSSYPFLSAGAFRAALAAHETGPACAPKPRLLDRVREAIGARHYSRRTEKAYIHWIKGYIFFHGKRHPVETPSVIPLPPTCWKRATTSARYRNCSATQTSTPR